MTTLLQTIVASVYVINSQIMGGGAKQVGEDRVTCFCPNPTESEKVVSRSDFYV